MFANLPQAYSFTQHVEFAFQGAPSGERSSSLGKFFAVPQWRRRRRVSRARACRGRIQTTYGPARRTRVYIQLTRIRPKKEEVNMHNKRESWLDFCTEGGGVVILDRGGRTSRPTSRTLRPTSLTSRPTSRRRRRSCCRRPVRKSSTDGGAIDFRAGHAQ